MIFLTNTITVQRLWAQFWARFVKILFTILLQFRYPRDFCFIAIVRYCVNIPLISIRKAYLRCSSQLYGGHQIVKVAISQPSVLPRAPMFHELVPPVVVNFATRHWALVWLFWAVPSLVVISISYGWKLFWTVMASIRFTTSVRAHVNLIKRLERQKIRTYEQIAAVIKGFVAGLAPILSGGYWCDG